MSVQPFVALAAWLTRKPVRMVYSRNESIMCSTKRHPSNISVRIGADRAGKLTAIDFSGDFNTGAYVPGADGREPRAGACVRPYTCRIIAP
jgi:CO/xanthine dehydrogenase Mo-binding subunit